MPFALHGVMHPRYGDLEEFRDVVNHLLDASIKCPSGNSNTIQREKLKHAKEDFKYLCDKFLFEEEHGCESFIRSGGSTLGKTDTDDVIEIMERSDINIYQNIHLCTVLLDVLGKCGDLGRVQSYHHELKSKIGMDFICFTRSLY